MMKTLLGFAALILGAVPLAAQTAVPLPAPLPVSPRPNLPETPEQLASRQQSKAADTQIAEFSRSYRAKVKEARFSGEIGIAHAANGVRSSVMLMGAQDADGNVREPAKPWRWASVTKQVIAVLVMQEAARGNIDLDQPVSRYLPGFRSANAARISVRQLLRHQTGLPNPDETPANSQSVPSFYTAAFEASRDPLTGFCAGTPKDEPGGAWSYNNCDYMVAGALLEAVTGKSWQELAANRLRITYQPIAERTPVSTITGINGVTASPPTPESWPGFVEGKPEPTFDITTFGAAGGLFGTVGDLLQFDLNLASGKLLPPDAMAQLWDGQPELGYLALGQWAFEAPLRGCAAPVRIVERRGAIGGVQVRNFILPERELALAMFTDQAEFDFGEIWQGAGFSYEMLSLAACPQGTS